MMPRPSPDVEPFEGLFTENGFSYSRVGEAAGHTCEGDEGMARVLGHVAHVRGCPCGLNMSVGTVLQCPLCVCVYVYMYV